MREHQLPHIEFFVVFADLLEAQMEIQFLVEKSALADEDIRPGG